MVTIRAASAGRYNAFRPETCGQGRREIQALAQQVAEPKTWINDDRTLWAERCQQLGNVVCHQIQATCSILYAVRWFKQRRHTGRMGAAGQQCTEQRRATVIGGRARATCCKGRIIGSSFNCGGSGHWRRDCLKKRRKSRTSETNDQEQVGVITNTDRRAEIYVRATVNGRTRQQYSIRAANIQF